RDQRRAVISELHEKPGRDDEARLAPMSRHALFLSFSFWESAAGPVPDEANAMPRCAACAARVRHARPAPACLAAWTARPDRRTPARRSIPLDDRARPGVTPSRHDA